MRRRVPVIRQPKTTIVTPATPTVPEWTAAQNALARVDPGTAGSVGQALRINTSDHPYWSPSGVIRADDFGAIAGGSTDNATAFAAMSAYVNAIPNPDGIPIHVQFTGNGDGKAYRYSDGLAFTRPVILTGGGTLDYTGTGYAVKLGPDGLGDADYHYHKHYEIHGLTLTGGANHAHGVYVNDHIVAPRLDRVRFLDFGNSTGFAVFFQADNWFAQMDRCTWVTSATSAAGRNWVKTHGFSTGDVWDGGACRLVMTNCNATNLNTGGGSGSGIGVWVNGFDSVLHGNVIEGFEPNVRVGPRALGTVIDSNYFEIIRTNASDCIIEYGDVTGGVAESLYVNYLRVLNNYVHIHNSDAIGIDGYFIGETQANAGLQTARIVNNHILGSNSTRELVRQSTTKAGQSSNQAWGNYSASPITHTTGGAIMPWGGDQGEHPRVGGYMDASTYLKVRGGVTANQYAGVQIEGHDGTVRGAVYVDPGNGELMLQPIAGSRVALPADKAIRTGRGTTAERPSSGGTGAGAMWFDTTLGKPIWSTGAGWVDATGTSV